eukprot:Skav225463  [mRNA]  locus=scaffold881:165337:168479:- [translate_table: standard]
MAVVIQKNVLGLDVSVHNAPVVHVLEGKGYSGNIKPGMVFAAKERLLFVDGEKLTTKCCLEQEAQRLRCVVGLKELDDERRAGHVQHIFLVCNSCLHLRLPNVAFAHRLQCIGVARVPMLHQIHSGVAPTSNAATRH